MLPCFDKLIQKASKSLSLVTYLSVENQSPFKEFIKAHEVCQNVRKFSLKIKSKQMQASHSKLIRAITGHLKSLESVKISMIVQQAKPFLYLGLYNTLITGDKFKKLSLHLEPSFIEFSGTDLLNVENKLENMHTMKLSCPGERLANEKVVHIFKAAASKEIEELNFDFIQLVNDRELEKRFLMLSNCHKLRRLKLSFEVNDFSEVSMEAIIKFILHGAYLESICLDIIGKYEGLDLDKMKLTEIVKNKRSIKNSVFQTEDAEGAVVLCEK